VVGFFFLFSFLFLLVLLLVLGFPVLLALLWFVALRALLRLLPRISFLGGLFLVVLLFLLLFRSLLACLLFHVVVLCSHSIVVLLPLCFLLVLGLLLFCTWRMRCLSLFLCVLGLSRPLGLHMWVLLLQKPSFLSLSLISDSRSEIKNCMRSSVMSSCVSHSSFRNRISNLVNPYFRAFFNVIHGFSGLGISSLISLILLLTSSRYASYASPSPP